RRAPTAALTPPRSERAKDRPRDDAALEIAAIRVELEPEVADEAVATEVLDDRAEEIEPEQRHHRRGEPKECTGSEPQRLRPGHERDEQPRRAEVADHVPKLWQALT